MISYFLVVMEITDLLRADEKGSLVRDSFFTRKRNGGYFVMPYDRMVHDFKGVDDEYLENLILPWADTLPREGIASLIYVHNDKKVHSLLGLPYKNFNSFGDSNLKLATFSDTLNNSFIGGGGVLLNKESNYRNDYLSGSENNKL